MSSISQTPATEPTTTTRRPLALVRRPGPRLDEGLVTHIDRTPIDVTMAARQWRAYVEVFEKNDWAVMEVAPADGCPDAVFIEDAIVVFGDLAVATRPGAEQRRPEVGGAEAAARALGLTLARIEAPGTLDGGDVLKMPGRPNRDAPATVYVGLTLRTNASGIEQLRALLAPRGFRVVAVPTTKVLHLKSAVTALPDGTVIGFDDAVDDPSVFGRYLAVPEESGAHVVHLSDRHLLIAGNAPQTAEMLRELEYVVTPVDISEFERLEGCVTCLSVRVR